MLDMSSLVSHHSHGSRQPYTCSQSLASTVCPNTVLAQLAIPCPDANTRRPLVPPVEWIWSGCDTIPAFPDVTGNRSDMKRATTTPQHANTKYTVLMARRHPAYKANLSKACTQGRVLFSQTEIVNRSTVYSLAAC